MSDESQDKKNTVPDVPAAKSYSTDGVTAEFDPGTHQVHVISPELRQQLSAGELPRLDPKYLLDTAPPNRRGGQPTAADPTGATTQPSLRRIRQAQTEPTWRKRAVQGVLVFLCLAIAWEVSVLIRASLTARKNSYPEPHATVQSSKDARALASETPEPEVLPNPAQGSAPAQPPRALEAPEALEGRPPEAATASPPVPARATRRSTPPITTERSPVLVRDAEPPAHPESGAPKPESGAAPEPQASSKSPSKVLFPPQ